MLVGFALSQTAVNALSQQFELPGREAYVTNLAIERTFGNGGESNAIVGVVTLPRGTTVDSPGIRAELRQAFARVAASVPGSRVVSYGSTPNRVLVSADGRTTMGLVYIPRPRNLQRRRRRILTLSKARLAACESPAHPYMSRARMSWLWARAAVAMALAYCSKRFWEAWAPF